MGNIFQKQVIPKKESPKVSSEQQCKELLQLCRDRIRQLEAQASKSQSLLAMIRITSNKHRTHLEEEQQKNKQLEQKNQQMTSQLSQLEHQLEKAQNLFK